MRQATQNSLRFLRTGATALAVLAAAAATATVSAQGFVDEVRGRATLKLKDVPSAGSVLQKIGLNRLADTELASVTATADTISGFVNFLAMRWNFLVFKGGTDTYFALEPVTASGAPRTPKLSDFIKAPGIELTDMLTFDRVVWVISAKEIDLQQGSLPTAAKNMFSVYMGNPTLPVTLEQGLTFFGMADLGKLKPLRDAIEAIGGKSSKLLFNANLNANFLEAAVKGEDLVPTAKFRASLPTIRPRIGKKIEIPADFTFGLIAEITPPSDIKFGYVGEAVVPFANPNIAKKRIDIVNTTMALEVAMALEGGKPVFSVSSTMFKGEAGRLKEAFGLPFIDLQDYSMEFEIKADAVAVGIGAGGRFYSNDIELFASVQVPAQTSGFPLPDSVKFMVVPNNPNAIGSLSVVDLTNAFADFTNAATGSKLPKPPLPRNFFEIRGAKKGEGPFVDINLNFGLDAGLDMAGALAVFGKELARVDIASIRPTSGIEIRAKTETELPIDILKLPQAEVDIKITAENITDPHVRLAVETMSVLGSAGNFEMSIDKNRQVAVVEGATPFNLFAASLVLDSSTQNITRPNFNVTGIIEGNFFNKLADGLTNATADLVAGTESAVVAMNSTVHDVSQKISQARIDKTKAVNDLERARKSVYAEFEKAKKKVDSLYSKYKKEDKKCSPAPWDWDHCVAAGALWTSYQAAKGVLNLAQKAVDGFLKGTGKALSAVVDGLNAAIQGFSKTLEGATKAIGQAVVKFTKVLDVGAKLAGKALDAVASVFDIEKLWMKGKLAILQGQQKGSLGVEYTLLGKQYLTDVSWDFKVPVDDIVKIFKPGSKDAPKPVDVAGGYDFNPSTTETARNVSDVILNQATLKAVTIPFDPDICVSNPYAIDDHIAQIKAEQTNISWRWRNAEAFQWVSALESSPVFRGGGSGSGSYSWVSARNGGVPRGAVSGGSEPGRSRLYVCRASYKGGTHPGKLVGRNCNIGWGGKERTINSYQVMVAKSGFSPSWKSAKNGSVPGGAISGGSEPGRSRLYICRASYKNGNHPGKLVGKNCNIGYGGKERTFSSYQIMVAGAGPTAGTYKTLKSHYESAKKSTSQRASASKYNSQATILRNLGATLKKLPSGDQGRRQIEIGLKARISDPSQDPDFLAGQRRELDVLLVKLNKLKTDPASPCGQAIKEANVKPAARTAPVAAAAAAPRGGNATVIGQAVADARQAALLKAGYGKAAADAAKALKAAQGKIIAAQLKTARAAADKRRRDQLVAFANRIKEYEKQKAQPAARGISPSSGKQPTAQQRQKLVAQAELAARKLQDQAAVRSLLGKTSKAKREAFQRAYRESAEKLKATTAARSVGGNARSRSLAKVEAQARAKLENLKRVDKKEAEQFAKTWAQASPRERAELIRTLAPARESVIGKAPSARSVAAADDGGTAELDPADLDIKGIRNFRNLKGL